MSEAGGSSACDVRKCSEFLPPSGGGGILWIGREFMVVTVLEAEMFLVANSHCSLLLVTLRQTH